MIKAIVIDDESAGRELLPHFLSNYCSGVEVVGTAVDVASGIDAIRAYAPDLVFLDVEMPGGSGFDVLGAFPEPDFEVVFVSGFDRELIRGLHSSALGYLEKPLNLEQLQELMANMQSPGQQVAERLEQFALQQSQSALTHLILPLENNYRRVAFEEICYLEAAGGYVVVYLSTGKSYMASRPLSYFEDLLPQSSFFRIHRSYVVNCTAVEGFDAGRGGNVHLKDGTELPIAFRRKAAFTKLLRYNG